LWEPFEKLNPKGPLFVCSFEKIVRRFQILSASLKKKSEPPFENLSSLRRRVADKKWMSPGCYMSTEIDYLKVKSIVYKYSPKGRETVVDITETQSVKVYI